MRAASKFLFDPPSFFLATLIQRFKKLNVIENMTLTRILNIESTDTVLLIIWPENVTIKIPSIFHRKQKVLIFL